MTKNTPETLSNPMQAETSLLSHILAIDSGSVNDPKRSALVREWAKDEINAWVGAIYGLGNAAEELRKHSITLFRSPTTGGRNLVTAARASRMLLLLQALLGAVGGRPAPRQNGYAAEAKSMLEKVGDLRKELNSLLATELIDKQTPENTVPFLAMLVVAVAHSQCAQHQPIAWESASAATARGAILAGISDEPGPTPITVAALDIIAFLIRHQSHAGKCARGTGGAYYLSGPLEDLVDRVVEGEVRMKAPDFDDARSKLRFAIRSCIAILGIVEEARNRDLPDGSNSDPRLRHGNIRAWDKARYWCVLFDDLEAQKKTFLAHDKLNELAGVVYRNQSEFDDAVRRVFGAGDAMYDEAVDEKDTLPSQALLTTIAGMIPVRMAGAIFQARDQPKAWGADRRQTWAYMSVLELTSATADWFREQVETTFLELVSARRRPPTEGTPKKPADVSVFAFDRRQVREISTAISSYLGLARKSANLGAWFETKLHRIPSIYGRGKPEWVVEVGLKDVFAAEAMLSPRDEPQEDADYDVPQQAEPHETAGELLRTLYLRAKKRFNLEACRLRSREPYLPFPLIERMLGIVYRLRPESCVHVSVSLGHETQKADDGPSKILALPETMSGEGAAELIDAIAHYVPSYVLNAAMAKGFVTCDVSLEGQEHEKTPPTGDENTIIDWPTLIEDALNSNNYLVLADTYLSDYNRKRRAVQLRREPSVDVRETPIQDVPTAIRGAMARDETEHAYFLGVDIGATFTKFCCYELGENGLKTVGERTFRISTPDVRNEPERGRVRAFVRKIAHSVFEQAGSDGGLSGVDLSLVKAIGLSWPGPVRDNHVMGTSGVVVRFGFERNIANNQIEKLMDLDIVGELRSVWSEFSDGPQPPTVVLLNDGTAEGIGVVHHRGGSCNPGALAVIKLGTGTAGAVFVDGRLVGGLGEWGKVILNLGLIPDQRYPMGLANHHLSAKALTTLAARIGRDLRKGGSRMTMFQSDTMASHDVGLMLEFEAHTDYTFPWIRDTLLIALGCREYAAHCAEVIDETVVHQVLDSGFAGIDPAAGRALARSLGTLGASAIDKLRHDVRLYGATRLAYLLALNEQIFEPFIEDDAEKIMPPGLDEALRSGAEIAKRSCEILGDYLGDFIVLLKDEFEKRGEQLSTFVTSGGVLSGETGKTVRTRASERANKYGCKLVQRDEVLEVELESARHKPTTSGGTRAGVGSGESRDPQTDHGTLGAAAYSAAEWLRERKQRILHDVKGKLQRLKPGSIVKITNKNKLELEGVKDPVDISELADDMSLLESVAASLGYHHSSITEGSKILQRWVLGERTE